MWAHLFATPGAPVGRAHMRRHLCLRVPACARVCVPACVCLHLCNVVIESLYIQLCVWSAEINSRAEMGLFCVSEIKPKDLFHWFIGNVVEHLASCQRKMELYFRV